MGTKYLAVRDTATAFAFLLWGASAVAQTNPILASRAEYAEAVRAYQAHDTSGFLEHAERAEALRPDHGGVLYALASAYALKGDDVYASDSRAPVVWRVRAGTDSLERFLESPLLLSAQSLALTPHERSLYLADYSRGMLKIDVVSRTATLLPCRDRVLALGIDGLYLEGESSSEFRTASSHTASCGSRSMRRGTA